jgi:glyoxylase-like metal-dependent hydrolase (beta-lactamase superfamily II)
VSLRPVTEEAAFEEFVREVRDRLTALETGGGIRGVVSFGDTIQIGDVEVTVKPGGGHPDGLVITVRNLKTGETSRLATLS